MTDWMDMDFFRIHMDINFFAQVAVVKAALPQLKKMDNSRIINVSSLAAMVAVSRLRLFLPYPPLSWTLAFGPHAYHLYYRTAWSL